MCLWMDWGLWEVGLLNRRYICCCSAVRSCPTLQPQGVQHISLPCPSQSPRACSNSCPLSQWRHSTISSSVVAFSPCLQSFPASESFPMTQLFTSGDQNVGSWCWERLRAKGEGQDRGWDSWMASLTKWTWVWANSGSVWRKEEPDILQSMASQSQTQLNDWTTTVMCVSQNSLLEIQFPSAMVLVGEALGIIRSWTWSPQVWD